MKALAVLAVAGVALAVTACENVTVQSVTERAIATKEIATATINAICERPEGDVIRTDIRTALSQVSSVDSRTICTDGLEVYLSRVVSERTQGATKTEVVVPVVEPVADPVVEEELTDG